MRSGFQLIFYKSNKEISRKEWLDLKSFAIFALPNLSVAQLVEQLTLNQWVTGSNPVRETLLNADYQAFQRWKAFSFIPLTYANCT